MSKLKVGMYGRLFTGDIVKILEVYDKIEPIHYKTDIKKAVRTWECDFVMWGYNKIDVAREEDYVNGEKIIRIFNPTFISLGELPYVITTNNKYEEYEIKTLLTKELYIKNMKVFGDDDD